MKQRHIYQALKYYNDAKSVRRAVERQSPKPIGRRILRRIYGKVTGRLARRLFG